MKKIKIQGYSASPIQDTRGEKIFYFLNASFLVLFAIVTLYPILVLIANSISDPYEVYTGHVTFYPKGFSLEGFRLVLKDGDLITGFKNSLIYTVLGTSLNVVITFITAYALSRKELKGRNIFSFFFAFTMWFSGGTIPTYLLVRDLGLMNNIWAVILPGLMSVWNMIVCRTYIQTTIPHEIYEAASIDGCGYWRYMLFMVVPLSGAILAILTLWYAIGHWNSYFNALIYLLDQSLHPVQLFLRQFLVALKAMNVSDLSDNTSDMYGIADIMRYALIVLSCLPLWIMYPFVQKYFVKGVMIGSVKG